MLQKRLGDLVYAGGMAGRGALAALASFLVACSDSPAAPKTGSLAITIVGLPTGVTTALTVSGPTGSGFSRTLSATDTLANLAPGRYTIVASLVSHASGVYEPATLTQQVEIRASTQPSLITVAYAITTGSIAFNVTGLPQGTSAAINVSGPAGFNQTVTESATLASLTPGSYLITSGSVSAGDGHRYSPVPLSQTVNVLAAETPRSVNARYDLVTGGLEVTVTGLPAQQNASVIVSAPGGYSTTLTGTTTLLGLFPGAYTIVASTVPAGAAGAGGAAYGPSPPSQNVEVVASLLPARATVSYVEVNLPPQAQFNLTIESLYITQAVQTLSAAVPLVAGQPGLLRVFVKASAPNVAAPTVRLRLYQGPDLNETVTLLPNVSGVPTSITEGTLASSWNYIVPSSQIKPGLRILADVDPDNAIAESDEGDNTFPPERTPFMPTVEITTPLNVTVVPVLQAPTGQTGTVTSANLGDFFAFAQKVFPIRDYRLTLHETFSTSWGPLESNDGNNSWTYILGEVNALRVAEGSSDYYMGIVGTPYSSGVAGLAFAPGRAALAWDRLPSASPVLAHEIAHNFGRMHAPCGGAANADPAYPHPSGTIGVFGYDISAGALKSPGTSDLMGYCGYGWISDYTYTGILSYRLSTVNSAVMPRVPPWVPGSGEAVTESFVQSPGVRTTLVVWGRAESGRLVLEPAFSANTRPVLPARSGPFRIEGRTAQGSVLFSYAFEGERPADVSDPAMRLFALAIPLDDSTLQSVARITLSSTAGLSAQRRMSTAGSLAFDAAIETPGTVRFRLDDPDVPLAVVRDRATQRIVAFVRPGAQPVRVRTRAEQFDVQFSNGVNSSTRVVRAVRR
jgi:hypothetical protein